MFGKVYIDGVEYELTGDPEFEYEGEQQFGYVTLIQGEGAVYIAKYKTEDDELPSDLSNPVYNEMIFDWDE